MAGTVVPEGRAEADCVAEVMRRERIYRRLLALADALAMSATVMAVALVYRVSLDLVVIALPMIAILVAKLQGLYDRDEMVIGKSTLADWRPLLVTAAIDAIAVDLLWPELTGWAHGGGMRLFVLTVVLILALGLVLRKLARALARRLAAPERCLIVGGAPECGELAERIAALRAVQLVGSFSAEQMRRPLSELRARMADWGVHRLVIVPDGQTPDLAVLEFVRAAKLAGLRVSLFPTLLAAVGGCTVFDELDGVTLLGVPRFGLSRSSRALKRAFDVAVAATALIVLSPLLAAVSLVIALGDGLPVLFCQTRIGRQDRPFTMLKFRTMVIEAERLRAQLQQRNEAGDGLFKLTDDPRVTRIGRWLRRCHVDELPQLLNVLAGDMSLVGPRPLIPEEDQRLSGSDRYRLHLTPGITGPWQVRGPLNTTLAEMAKLDYLYISNWSLWRDLEILLRTAGRMLMLRGQ